MCTYMAAPCTRINVLVNVITMYTKTKFQSISPELVHFIFGVLNYRLNLTKNKSFHSRETYVCGLSFKHLLGIILLNYDLISLLFINLIWYSG